MMHKRQKEGLSCVVHTSASSFQQPSRALFPPSISNPSMLSLRLWPLCYESNHFIFRLLLGRFECDCAVCAICHFLNGFGYSLYSVFATRSNSIPHAISITIIDCATTSLLFIYNQMGYSHCSQRAQGVAAIETQPSL